MNLQLTILRLLAQLVLVTVFVTFFGYDFISRYLDKKTLVLSSKLPSSGILAPSVTFCGRNMATKAGWRAPSSSSPYSLSSQCGEGDSDPHTCVLAGTYNLSEVVRGVQKGSGTRVPLQESLWSVEYGFSYFGRCYTFTYPQTINTEDRTDQLLFFLDRNVNFRIFIHEQNYFEMVFNPLSLPSIELELVTNSSVGHFYRLQLTNHRELNVPQDPCEEREDYKFQACVKESLSSQVGVVRIGEGGESPCLLVRWAVESCGTTSVTNQDHCALQWNSSCKLGFKKKNVIANFQEI